MTINIKKHFLFLLLLIAIALPAMNSNVYAANKKSSESYEDWLEKYGAWDILEKNYSNSDESPELILKRAQTAFNLGRYEACLTALQGTPAFDNKEQEISRLWLGGQTQRALGFPVKAVIWFSQAARLMDQENMVNKLRNETNLKSVWFDVWRSMYWGYFVTSDSAREARKIMLDQSFNQAEKAWPKTYFIVHSKNDLAVLEQNKDRFPVENNSTIVTTDDRLAIAQSLAASSLGEWAKSSARLEAISNSTVRSFWTSINSYMESGNYPESTAELSKENLVHPLAFFEAGVLEPVINSPALWQLAAPSSAAWNVFRSKLIEMNPEEALETIDRETGSLLLSTDLVNALQNYRLAFAILSGDKVLAEKAWKRLDQNSLPMSLRVAAAILFKPPFSKVLNSSDYGNNDHLYILTGLCEAAGIKYFPEINTPFWESCSGSNLNQKINLNPLDRLLVYSELSSESQKNMSEDIARRSAFLFPNSKLGAESLIYLAEKAAKNRNYKLSAFYLKRVNQEKFGSEIKLKWLISAVEYDLAVGNDAKATKAYNEIISLGGTLPAEKELKLALLIQQKGELKKAQAILERIWKGRDSLDNELKAEILFWIAEGEHAMGNKEKALKHYLELAWKFPEQNIWATTAMYRASMIYEHKGQFETAKRFLKSVIKQADRKAQKEAAKSRLDAIDNKMAKTGAGKDAVFPF